MVTSRRSTRVPCRIIERIYGPGNFDDAGDDLVHALRLASDEPTQHRYRFAFDRTNPNPWFHAMIFETDGISDTVYDRFMQRLIVLGLVEVP